MHSIEEILQELEIEFKVKGEHRHATEMYISIDCPFCGKDTQSFRLGIHKSGTYATCWVCGPHNLVDALASYTERPHHEIKKLLKDLRTTYDIPTVTRGHLVLPKGIKSLEELPQHRQYLKQRGYDWKVLDRLWRVQGIGLATRLSWRIFIPITFNGDVVSWTTRTISKDKSITRYISASPQEESISHKTLLFGEDFVRHAAIVVEGPFDAMRIGPGAVATLGTGFSQAQVNRLVRFPIRCICFDSETEAQKRAKKLMNALIDFPGETFIAEFETGKDAGEANEKEITRLRREILQ